MTRSLSPVWLLICLLSLVAVSHCFSCTIQVYDLRSEYRITPVLDVIPRLSWKISVVEPENFYDLFQDFYQYQSFDSPAMDHMIYDSSVVASNASVGVDYTGPVPSSRSRVYWRVRVSVFNMPYNMSCVSNWSSLTYWDVGLLTPADWSGAEWIAASASPPSNSCLLYSTQPAPMIRTTFLVQKENLTRAMLYISGLGFYEAQMNGLNVTDTVLNPPFTSVSHRIEYNTFDVTNLTVDGLNAFGAMLGNGWFNPLPLLMWGHLNIRNALTVGSPRLLALIVLEYSNDSTLFIPSNSSWKSFQKGPLRRNSIYLGEIYDANREQSGWSSASYNDSAWSAVVQPQTNLSSASLRSASTDPIRVFPFAAFSVTQPPSQPNVFIFNMGKNFAGWIEICARRMDLLNGSIYIRYGELLFPNGTLNVATSCAGQIHAGQGGPCAPYTAFQTDTFILNRNLDLATRQCYRPRFTWHGFQFAEVTGFVSAPSLSNIIGYAVHADLQIAGNFSSSNPLFNSIHSIVNGAFLSNALSIQSDCPHRERFGYGGDVLASCEAIMRSYQMQSFYSKRVRDFVDEANSTGQFGETAPYVGIQDSGLGGRSGPIEWGTVVPFLSWQLYRYYGDKRTLEDSFSAIELFINLILNVSSPNFLLQNGLGDFGSLNPPSIELAASAFVILNLDLAQKIATVLGRNESAAVYGALALKARESFNAQYLKASGAYENGTQSAQAYALSLQLAPLSAVTNVTSVLLQNIGSRQWKMHHSVGIFGMKFLLAALCETGNCDVAAQCINQTTYPSYGYMVANHSTTLWELWVYDPYGTSHNHAMYASVDEFFYNSVGGLSVASDAIGADHLIFSPQFSTASSASVSFESVRGTASISWSKTPGEAARVNITVPLNTRADVIVPNGFSVSSRNGLELVAQSEGKRKSLRIGSGVYMLDLYEDVSLWEMELKL